MCDPVTALAMAGTGLQVAGQVKQGRAAQRQADQDAARMEYQAAIEQDNALATADQIRRQGVRDRGQTVATIAASGVKIGEGSALDAEREVMQDAEADAYMAILNGGRAAQGLRSDAAATRRAGRQAKRAANIAAASTLLSAGAQGMRSSGWRSAGPGFSGTQAPAPVEDRSWRS